MPWLPNWLTGYDEENADRAAATDAHTAAWQQNMRDRGTWTEWEWQQAVAHTAAANAAAEPGEIDRTFTTAVADNAAAMAGGVRGTLNAVGGTIWKAVPWWVWLLGALALFIQLGGGEVIKAQIRKLS